MKIKNLFNKIKSFYLIIGLGLLTSNIKMYGSPSKLSRIKLYNKTGDALFAGVYEVKDNNIQLNGEIIKLPLNIAYQLEYTYSPNQKIIIGEIKDTLFKQECLNDLLSIKPKRFFNTDIYFGYKKNILTKFNPLEWKLHKRKLFLKKKFLLQNNFKKNIAKVRNNTELSQSEEEFINKRLSNIKNNLEELFQKPINKTPRIAICASGGGFRAMFAALGLLDGFNEMNLLDNVLYYNAISGSSWTVISWLASGKDFNSFKEKFLSYGEDKFWIPSKNASIKIGNLLQQKILYKQPFNVIDYYGTLLTDKLLKHRDSQQFSTVISDIMIKDNLIEFPYPIFNAAFRANQKYELLEISPYEIGSDYLNSYIPNWALGRDFDSGESKNIVPEISLGFLMGILGSSFSASINDILKYIKENMPENSYLYNSVAKLTEKTHSSTKKFSPAKVANFSYNIENSPIKDKKTLELVDGGYVSNIPLISMLKPERKIDIIFILDNKQEINSVAKNLKIAEDLVYKYGFKIPDIDYTNIKNINIFKKEGCPTIVYIPLKKNENYSKDFDPANAYFCNTINFYYTRKKAELLAGLTKHTILENKKLILDLIYNCCES